jgi:hypothetical protein
MFAIRNYGLLWERKYIHYGWQGSSGHLNGYRKGYPEVDFREQSGVYVLYDKDMLPVYVGQAGKGNANLFNRLKQHESDHLWNRWNYFSWFGLCKANKSGNLSLTESPDRTISGKLHDALDDIEGVLIQVIETKLNKQGPKWKGVHQFWQLVDENVEETTHDDLLERQEILEEKIEKLTKIINKMS